MNLSDEYPSMLDLAGVAALGSLSAKDLQNVKTQLATSVEFRAEFQALRSAADMLGITAEATVEPARSARMKRRLLEAIRARQPIPITAARRRSSRSAIAAMLLATAASLAFAFVSTVQNIGLRSGPDDIVGIGADDAAIGPINHHEVRWSALRLLQMVVLQEHRARAIFLDLI